MDELGIELDRARWRTNVKNRGDDLIRYIRESLYNNNNSNNNGKKKGQQRRLFLGVCLNRSKRDNADSSQATETECGRIANATRPPLLFFLCFAGRRRSR